MGRRQHPAERDLTRAPASLPLWKSGSADRTRRHRNGRAGRAGPSFRASRHGHARSQACLRSRRPRQCGVQPGGRRSLVKGFATTRQARSSKAQSERRRQCTDTETSTEAAGGNGHGPRKKHGQGTDAGAIANAVEMDGFHRRRAWWQGPRRHRPVENAEKDITLAAAQELAKQLASTGVIRPVLSRSDDRYLKLRQRINLAREQKADIFISLHADAAPSAKAQASPSSRCQTRRRTRKPSFWQGTRTRPT